MNATRAQCDLDEETLYEEAVLAAAKELADFINEAPQHWYHFTADDCELAAQRCLAPYRQALKRLP